MDERTRSTDDEATPELRRAPPAPIIRQARAARIRIGRRADRSDRRIVAGGYLIYRTDMRRSQPPPAARNPQPRRNRSAPPRSARAISASSSTRSAPSRRSPPSPCRRRSTASCCRSGSPKARLVKKGDFLAQIDPRPYELLQAQFEGQLAHDQGLLAQAQVDLARYQKLAEQNSIARQQYEDQIYIVQQYQGTVKLDQAQIDQQKLNVALLPHRLAGHRPRRPSPGRSGKLCADQQHHRHRGRHADAADHGDLPGPRGRSAATSCRS